MKEQRKIFTTSRILLLLLALILLGAMTASVCALGGILRHRTEKRREQAANMLNQTLARATSSLSTYIKRRSSERETIRKSLGREAGTVCADIEVFLQATLIRREAEKARQQLKQEISSKTAILKLAHEQIQQAEKLARDAVSNAQDEQKNEEDGTTSSSTTDTVIVESRDVENFFGTDATDSSQKDDRANKELKKLLGQLETLRSETGNKLSPLAQTKKFKDAAGWQEQLLKESGPDLENLLPENSVLTIARAGGRILLAIGGGKASKNEIRAEATRTLLFNPQGDPQQWVLRVVLAETNAPAAANAPEIVQLLTNVIPTSSSDTGSKLSGFLFPPASSKAIKFPEGNRSAIPQHKGRWSTYATHSQLYRTAQSINDWRIGIQLTLPNVDTHKQLKKIAAEYPGYTAVFCVAQTIFLCGLIYLGILTWRANHGVTIANIHGAAAGNASPKPELGSLKRLQQSNRGRLSGGSRILELAKSPVLRELAGKIRPPETSANKADTSGLRQYR